jgi:hypothetical protein
MLPVMLFERSAKKGPDFIASAMGLVVSVELKAANKRLESFWLVSAKRSDDVLELVLDLRLPLGGVNEDEALEECQSILTSFIEPLGRQFMDSASFGEAPDRGTHEQRQLAIVAHLRQHDSFQLLGHKDDLYPRTAKEYNFVKSFGLGTAVSAIAAFESVPSSTITRRLSRARDAGLVAKQLKTLRKPKNEGKEKSN